MTCVPAIVILSLCNILKWSNDGWWGPLQRRDTEAQSARLISRGSIWRIRNKSWKRDLQHWRYTNEQLNKSWPQFQFLLKCILRTLRGSDKLFLNCQFSSSFSFRRSLFYVQIIAKYCHLTFGQWEARTGVRWTNERPGLVWDGLMRGRGGCYQQWQSGETQTETIRAVYFQAQTQSTGCPKKNWDLWKIVTEGHWVELE